MATGQWLTPTDGARWWFDSGALSLDFAHTGPAEGTPTSEQLHEPSDLASWLGERFENLSADANARDLADARTLRAAVYGLARAAADGREVRAEDVDTVNLYAATPDIPPVLAGGGRQAGRTVTRIGQALSTIARDAVQLFAVAEGRVRECAADDCHLVFYDESRTNNRRWCSMQRCGNRAKVRAFREKEKK